MEAAGGLYPRLAPMGSGDTVLCTSCKTIVCVCVFWCFFFFLFTALTLTGLVVVRVYTLQLCLDRCRAMTSALTVRKQIQIGQAQTLVV